MFLGKNLSVNVNLLNIVKKYMHLTINDINNFLFFLVISPLILIFSNNCSSYILFNIILFKYDGLQRQLAFLTQRDKPLQLIDLEISK